MSRSTAEEARSTSRKAFWDFAKHWPQFAEQLLKSFDSSTQQYVHDELRDEQGVCLKENSMMSLGHPAMQSKISEGPSQFPGEPRVVEELPVGGCEEIQA